MVKVLLGKLENTIYDLGCYVAGLIGNLLRYCNIDTFSAFKWSCRLTWNNIAAQWIYLPFRIHNLLCRTKKKIYAQDLPQGKYPIVFTNCVCTTPSIHIILTSSFSNKQYVFRDIERSSYQLFYLESFLELYIFFFLPYLLCSNKS